MLLTGLINFFGHILTFLFPLVVDYDHEDDKDHGDDHDHDDDGEYDDEKAGEGGEGE